MRFNLLHMKSLSCNGLLVGLAHACSSALKVRDIAGERR